MKRKHTYWLEDETHEIIVALSKAADGIAHADIITEAVVQMSCHTSRHTLPETPKATEASTEPPRKLTYAEQRALDERARIKAVAESDVVARATGREDIDYDAGATPSRSTPPTVAPRTLAVKAKPKVEFKSLLRPNGTTMGKQRHSIGEQGKR